MQIWVAGGPVVGLLLKVGVLPQVRVLAVILVLQRSCQGRIIHELQVTAPDRARLRGTCGTWRHVVRRRRSIPGHSALAAMPAVSKLHPSGPMPHSLLEGVGRGV